MLFAIVYMYKPIPPPPKKPIEVKFFVRETDKPATIRYEEDEEAGNTNRTIEDDFTTPSSLELED